MSPLRTRFPPSPTGALHLGGARTALFNYLLARHAGGRFVLRIEDTDRERSQPRFTEEILEALTWLGLEWDEGPFLQTERMELYRDAVDRLLAAGDAYRCTCTPDELETRRAAALEAGRRVGYDRQCRPGVGSGPVEGRPHSIRFAVPLEGRIPVDDQVKGPVDFDAAEIEDFVIVRSDGNPTYNLVATVDDAAMGITHVVRGDDHLTNTPKQVLIYRALGAELPVFAHLPQVLGTDGTRLSKRHGATATLAYRDLGYYPDALVNFLARLGWSHGDQEIFTRTELVQAFSLENVGKSPGVFNPEKLDWLNGEYLRARTPDELASDLREFAGRQGVELPADSGWLARMVATLRERVKTLAELLDAARYYLEDEISMDEKAAGKFLTPETASLLEDLISRLDALADWSLASLEAAFAATLAATGAKLGAVAQPVRVAVTGSTKSPGIYELLDVLGRDRTLARLRAALARSRSEGPSLEGRE